MLEVDWEKWFFNFEAASQESKKSRRPILLQFHRVQCSGCRKMYAVTYPDPEVSAELYQWFVPLRLDILKEHHIRSSYSAVWTPSFYFLDYRGKLLHSLPGYLPPEDFRIVMRLGLAAYHIPRGKYSEAIEILTDGLEQFSTNPRAATLRFWRGMANYLKTYDSQQFREEMLEIQETYPNSPEARMWPWEDR
jgi:thioredoxin-related protein